MLIASGNVRVQGLATDATSPIRSVIVNGVEQLATPVVSHAIDVSPPGNWGLNVVEATATDSCGNTATVSQSYLRSPEYRPAATAANAAARVARGQGVRLTAAALDDGNRSDVDDAATLIQRVLERNLSTVIAQATVGQVISNPSVPCPGVEAVLTVAAPGATVTGPRVDQITLRAGGMRQVISAQRVTVPIRIELVTNVGIPLTGCVQTRVPFSAGVSASFTSDSTSSTSVTANGRVDVSLASIDVALSSVQVVFTGNSTVDGILSALGAVMSGFVELVVEAALRAQLPIMLETFLNTPLFVSGTVSSGPFDETLNAVAGIDGVAFAPATATQTVYTQIHPVGTGTAYPALGAIARPTAAPSLAPYVGAHDLLRRRQPRQPRPMGSLAERCARASERARFLRNDARRVGAPAARAHAGGAGGRGRGRFRRPRRHADLAGGA